MYFTQKKFFAKIIKSSECKIEKFSQYKLKTEFLSLLRCWIKWNYFKTAKMVHFGRKNYQTRVKNLGNKTEFCANCAWGLINFARKSIALSGLFCAKWYCAKCTSGVSYSAHSLGEIHTNIQIFPKKIAEKFSSSLRPIIMENWKSLWYFLAEYLEIFGYWPGY